jgi:hypothetical protein
MEERASVGGKESGDVEIVTELLGKMSNAYCQARAVVGTYLIHQFTNDDREARSAVGSIAWKEPPSGRTNSDILDWKNLKNLLASGAKPAYRVLSNACEWAERQAEIPFQYGGALELGREGLSVDEEAFLKVLDVGSYERKNLELWLDGQDVDKEEAGILGQMYGGRSYFGGSASYVQSIAAVGYLISVRDKTIGEPPTFKNMKADLRSTGARVDNVPTWEPVGNFPSAWPPLRDIDKHHEMLQQLNRKVRRLAAGQSLNIPDLCQVGHFCMANEVVARETLGKIRVRD